MSSSSTGGHGLVTSVTGHLAGNRRVVFGVDGSKVCRLALRQAIHKKLVLPDDELILVHVQQFSSDTVDSLSSRDSDSQSAAASSEQVSMGQVYRYMEDWAEMCEKLGVRLVHVKILQGTVKKSLCDFVSKHKPKIDLVLLGSRGAGEGSSSKSFADDAEFIGSVSSYVQDKIEDDESCETNVLVISVNAKDGHESGGGGVAWSISK
eukprot:TRINITY_DN66166_c6_g1_i1.p1 TRINITY_DN66166_c6_g1~~TRINITY_DN66166_c6_g1_i1.p1  ORF type:complete len:207 (+),score=121.73 TRINITY_DN66166_c6_g1_i1:45-665(+)